jgi:hypothetical protein
MITITFPDRETEKRALAFLIGRFSGRVLRSGEHQVPEAALEALANQRVPFAVRGKVTSEPRMGAAWMRGDGGPCSIGEDSHNSTLEPTRRQTPRRER